MRPTIVVAIMTCALAISLGAQEDLSKLTLLKNDPVTIQFHAASFEDAMRLLATSVGIEIRIASDVKVTKPIDARFKNAEFADVFLTILKGSNLHYSIVNDKTVLVTVK